MEVCIESVQGALAAGEAGADRVELCSALALGGLTPGTGLIEAVRDGFSGPVFVLLRPRPGDFLYDAAEVDCVRREVEHCARLGVDGVVVGALTTDGSIDLEALRRWMHAANDLEITFHRAFDLAREPLRCLDQLIELGVDRVLSSGQAARAIDGAELLGAMVDRARERIGVLAGAGIDAENVEALVRTSGVREVHLSAGRSLPSPMRYRGSRVALGRASGDSEYERRVTDAEELVRVRQALDRVARER